MTCCEHTDFIMPSCRFLGEMCLQSDLSTLPAAMQSPCQSHVLTTLASLGLLLLQTYKDKVRKAAAAAATSGVPADPADLEAKATQQQATLQYLTFLTTIAFITGEPLQLKYLQRCALLRVILSAALQSRLWRAVSQPASGSILSSSAHACTWLARNCPGVCVSHCMHCY